MCTEGDDPYIINLDPAVLELPFTPNIDIRDTVDYREVMRQYNLGPNGGILTSLNLFTTKFDQVLEVLQKRTQPEDPEEVPINKIIIDTPGQIEIFTWSASGAIIMEALASAHPSVIVYVIDTPRCARPATFMSNMLYACSIMYKTRLPMVLVFNKTDLEPADRCLEWMQDVLSFQEALQEDDSYMTSMIQSMSLVLEEFYQTLRVCAVSSFTGDGMPEFFEKVEEAVGEYESDYLPALLERIARKKSLEDEAKTRSLVNLMGDLSVSKSDDKGKGKVPTGSEPWDVEEEYCSDEAEDEESLENVD